MLDGEIVCLDESGVSQFSNLLFHRGEPRFYAFDLLSLNGKDQRYLPLGERKHGLRGFFQISENVCCIAITWKVLARIVRSRVRARPRWVPVPNGNMIPIFSMGVQHG